MTSLPGLYSVNHIGAHGVKEGDNTIEDDINNTGNDVFDVVA